MPINPKKSREARSQIGPVPSAAASSTPQHDSPALSCDLRGPQPAICRGEIAGQPFDANVRLLNPETLKFSPSHSERASTGLLWPDVLFWCAAVALFFFGLGMLVGFGK